MRHSTEVARSWLEKSLREEDPYNRFVFLWIAFNALYNRSSCDNDRAAIRSFLSDQALGLRRRQIEYILQHHAVRFFATRVIRDCRGGGGDTATDAVRLQSARLPPHQRLSSLSMILYQVRCNLFHGDKLYERDADRIVVQNAADALTTVLRGILQMSPDPS
jgi:hypothetical protein